MGREYECKQTASLLWDYAEQRLAEAKRTRVEAHLRICAPCRAQAEEYRQTARMLDSYRCQLLPVQENGWPSLQQQLAAASSQRLIVRHRFLPALAWGSAALACGLAALFLVRIGLPTPRGQPTGGVAASPS